MNVKEAMAAYSDGTLEKKAKASAKRRQAGKDQESTGAARKARDLYESMHPTKEEGTVTMTMTAKAHAHIPGYDDHAEAENRINEEITRNRAIKHEPPISTADFVKAALACEDFPNDPHFRNEEIRAEGLNAGLRAKMLRDALKAVQERKRDLIRNNSGSALGYLRAELATLMDDVRTNHQTLGSIRTAEQVLAANDPEVVSAWQATKELASRYVEIRGLQRSFTAPGLGDGEISKIATVGHIRNSLEQGDYWLSKREKSITHRATNDQLAGVRNFNAWLGAGGTAPFKHSSAAIPSTDSTGNPAVPWDYLVWLATKAEPWVPSVSDLIEAFDAANLAVTVTDYSTFHAQEAARDRYFEVIGVTPLVGYTNSATDTPEVRRVKRPSFGD